MNFQSVLREIVDHCDGGIAAALRTTRETGCELHSRRVLFPGDSGAGVIRHQSAMSGLTSPIENAPTKAIVCPTRSG